MGVSMRFLAHVLLTVLATITQPVHSQIRGVNLGGWLVTEEWITPSVYDAGDAADEWHLCNALGKKKCYSQLHQHWRTFYNRDDFVAIQAAGLNAVRIPIGYWAVDIADYEPYVDGQYNFLIQAVYWAQELGLQVMIDLHGAPGSQNGQDNSGLEDVLQFPDNSTNSDRSLRVLRNLTEEFTQDIYGGVVKNIELLNEPRVIGTDFSIGELKSFYASAAYVVQLAANNQTNVTIHDAFYGPDYWINYDPANADATATIPQLTVDTHQYYAFSPYNKLTRPEMIDSICNMSQLLKQTNSGIPPTIVGEWSLETGNAPNASSHDQNGEDDQAKRTWYRMLFEAQNAAYTPNGEGQASLGWFFWAWKTEYDIDTWSYRKGMQDGYIPTIISDPSTLVFPVLANGCIDTTYNYTAPKTIPSGGGRVEVSWWLSTGLVALIFAFMV